MDRRLRWTRLVVALTTTLASMTTWASAQTAPDTGDGAARGAASRRALLVGVQDYGQQHGWTPLTGTRADIAAMRDTLVERAGFLSENVHTLLDAEATREGILTAFETLIEDAQADDLLLFFFAGHGSQVPDDDGDELDGWDETLVPFDATTDDGLPNDVRDDDLRDLIERANRKTEHVVLIFDCCSSGTNVRGTKAPTRRYVDPAVRGLAGSRSAQRDDTPDAGSGFFDKQLKYVAISACRAAESAYEHVIPAGPGEERDRTHGLFTYCLLQELHQPIANLSYQGLVDRVRRRVRSRVKVQTPVIEGALDKNEVFSGSLASREVSYKLREENGRFLVEGGMVHGLLPGTIMNVLPADATEHRPEERVGELRLEHVGAVESTVSWITEPSGDGVEAPYRVFTSERGPGELRLPFAVVASSPRDRPRAMQLASDLEATNNLRAVSPEEAVVLVTAVDDTAGRRWRVTDQGGTVLPIAAGIGNIGERARFLSSLSRLATAHRVRESIANESSFALRVEAAVEHVERDGDQVRVLADLQRDDAGMPTLRPGDIISARLTNASPVPVFATLVIISPDAGIAVFPQSRTEDDAIPPGRTVRSPILRMEIPDGGDAFYETGTESFRWFVTTEFHDVRSLAQAPAITPALTRGVRELPSEFGDEQAHPVDDWLTHTTEIRMVVD